MASADIERVREAAEASLSTFIKLVAPHRVLGGIHEELLQWWTRSEAKEHQLTLMPRDHQKSAMIAYRVAWTITKDPCATFLYISSTSGLAEKQLYFIKNILDSKIYRRYWPEMLNVDEGKRSKWAADAIIVDHPRRRAEGIRDDTIKTAGLTTGITGLHFTHAVLDDVVVKENAENKEGRDKVKAQYSLLSSIESTGTDKDSKSAYEWIVGTRYHPDDLYAAILEMEAEVYDKNGVVTHTDPVYEVFQREVEDRGDGTGEFLWPRQQNANGRWYGFDARILANKRAKYLDKSQYYSQYYNNPNSFDNKSIDPTKFQYYDRKYLECREGFWYYKDLKLNITAALDFAFSLKKKADYTALVTVGTDCNNNHYVLDIDRFKTDRIKEYFEHIILAFNKWGFRKIRCEVTVAQQAIVTELRESYIKQQGIPLAIDEYRPTRDEGDKEERIEAILGHRYDNMQMWHYKGGNNQTLEEELILKKPPHDDIKDALANAIAIATAPRRMQMHLIQNNIKFHPRFGGIN